MSGSSDSTAGREKGGSAPRVAFTLVEAAQSIGMSEASFRRHVLPELRTVKLGPRLTVVRLVELNRYWERREALDNSI